jgi:hypothetical protein
VKQWLKHNAKHFEDVGKMVAACGIVAGATYGVLKPWAKQEIAKDFVPRQEFNVCKENTDKVLVSFSDKLERIDRNVAGINGKLSVMYRQEVMVDSKPDDRTAMRTDRSK